MWGKTEALANVKWLNLPDVFALKEKYQWGEIHQLTNSQEILPCKIEPNEEANILKLKIGEGRNISLVKAGQPISSTSDVCFYATSMTVAGDELGVVGCEVLNPLARFGSKRDSVTETVRLSWAGTFRFKEEKRDSNGKIISPGLRPPQIGAIHAIAAHWTVSDKSALVVMPTGTGKTEVMLATLVYTQPKRVLVLVPSNALRAQTFNKFTRLGLLFAAGVISDQAFRPAVAVIRHTPKTSEDIDEFEFCNVAVSTVAAIQTLDRSLLKTFLEKFDTVYIDEAHHLPANSWMRLHDGLKKHKVLQFTATPFRMDGQRIPGRIIFNFPLRLAQAQGYFRKIQFIEVFETDSDKSDQKIAEKAVEQLRKDIDNNFDHFLLARTETMDEAERLYRDVYRQYADLNPTVIHSGTKGHADRLAAIRKGEHKIVICVDMFGEGFDLPNLKVAALHVPHKSLAITLQFTGRFTRDAKGIGDPTMVANTADLRVSEAIEELYAEDSDWNELIPELSSKAIQSVMDFSEFLDKINFSDSSDDELFGLNVLQPKTSTVIYTAKRFTPTRFRQAFSGRRTSIERTWYSKTKDLVVFITRTRFQIEWARVKEATDEVWDLYIVSFDEQKELLFIYSSQTGTLHKELAEQVSDSTSKLIDGEQMFRAFHGFNRLVFHSAGLRRQGKLRFTMYTGLDIAEAIDPTTLSHATKSNLFAVGYENGERGSIGVSYKGRVWSMSSCSIPDWVNWCGKTADKILNSKIPTNAYLEETLIPRLLSKLPNSPLFSAMFPDELYSGNIDSLTLYSGTEKIALHNLGIKDIGNIDDRTALLTLSIGDDDFPLQMEWGPEEGMFKITQNSGGILTLVSKKLTRRLDEYFSENPPSLLSVDGSEITGGQILERRKALPQLFPQDRIISIDWKNVPIQTESKWRHGTSRPDSVQGFFIERLKNETNEIIFDDDDSGEIADIVEIVEMSKDELHVKLYHCKYSSGATPGNRVGDLYIVCGQAARSVKWTYSVQDFFKQLRKREQQLNGRPTRFEKGNMRTLIQIQKRLARMRVRYQIFVVQPGLLKQDIDAAGATPLVTANAFVAELTGAPLSVFAS